MRTLGRREFLTAGALAAGGALLTSGLAFARTNTTSRSRVVFVILRGALDGLAVVPPYGDPAYSGLRRELALGAPGSAGGALPLNGFYGLHPSLQFLQESYTARELLVVHAVASPYRERSHFDGQDVLENGSVKPHALQTGWLNRALATLQSGSGASKEMGVALGQNVPLLMRGPAAVTSWSPSKLAALDEETLDRITDLYASDPLLAKRLADALDANQIATASDTMTEDGQSGGMSLQEKMTQQDKTKPARYVEIVTAAAGFLRREDGPKVAVFDTTGWDTHANEGNAQGQLAGRLSALDGGLRTLKQELGSVWSQTAVVLATEFGRTAATNGTRGTDHGTGTAAFLLGGAVQGGRVLSDWPGLASRSLYQGRDLQPTADLRSLLKGVLSEHLHVSSAALETSVFPESASAKPWQGLMRG
ncbi:MAG TPA: DUF1501 domain-containing protein [Steroidobacteraceae bacterium]|nr:DUF1501 domain-containing protein [Steroidobacteraceae bacterium]